MQFTSVSSKEKDYDIYFKLEKLVHRNQQQKKNVSQLFGSGKIWFLAISSMKNCRSCLERDKSGSLLFGDQKLQFITVRSKEKDYDMYLKSEKLVHSNQEHEKIFSQLFRCGKNWFVAITRMKNTVRAIWREKKWKPTIWRIKNVVNHCQEQGKRL